MTKCECTTPGFCSKHERDMCKVRFNQCKNETGYFEAFQADLKRNGPRGLGDVVATVLEETGVAAIVKKVKGGKCGGCKKRQEKLNDLVPFD